MTEALALSALIAFLAIAVWRYRVLVRVTRELGPKQDQVDRLDRDLAALQIQLRAEVARAAERERAGAAGDPDPVDSDPVDSDPVDSDPTGGIDPSGGESPPETHGE